MQNQINLDIAVFPGDGIGIEVIDSALAVLKAAQAKVGGFKLHYQMLEGGAGHYRDHGKTMPDSAWTDAGDADAILLGAMGLPEVRYPDGTEITPQIDLRFHFDLYAGVRPFKAFPNGPAALAHAKAHDIDFVLVRESTEGLFASMNSGTVEDDEVARDTQVITRQASERLFHFSFDLARQRKATGKPGKLTLIDKANVFASFAFFRKVFDEVAEHYPDIETERLYVDASALDLIRRPWEFDVLVTENMFGDILSDLAAGLVGGMGFAPSADIGDNNAVFQPAHGTAPDIAGQGKANPTATLLSAAMMLDWLAQKHSNSSLSHAANLITDAVESCISVGDVQTFDAGGRDGTEAMTNAVVARIEQT
jgi:3-isopropylmalate dehydrogenase